MRFLYDIIFILFAILYMPFSVYKQGWRGFNLKARLGFGLKRVTAELEGAQCIWIHAVSVGEVMTVSKLVAEINKSFPDIRIVISVTTQTGMSVAEKLKNGNNTVVYSPLDLSFVIEGFLNALRPRLVMLVETEIWPNFINALSARNIPVALVNGRISPGSFRGYRLIKFLVKRLFSRINLLCMQTQTDAERAAFLGASPDRITLTGSMKFDIDTAVDIDSGAFRQQLGLKDAELLIAAGSTHPGEEEILLDAYKNLLKDFKDLKLLIAPRHVERSAKLERLVRSKGFAPLRISKKIGTVPTTADARAGTVPIFLLDTIGQLKDYYSAADLVFIGGSLVPHGGQNPIEPAAFGRPVIFGPHMFNFRDISKLLLEQKAAIKIDSGPELEKAMSALLKDAAERERFGAAASEALKRRRGATNKTISAIKQFLS